MPVIPYNPVGIATRFALQNRFHFDTNAQTVPITFKKDPEPGNTQGESFTFPIDPLVSVAPSTKIVTRQIAKYDGNLRGTVKEKWAMDDWSIKLSALLMTDETKCIDDYIKDLRKFVEYDKPFQILCPYLIDAYGITYAVIESCDFPFTQGKENQTVALTLRSDDPNITLLAEKNYNPNKTEREEKNV